MIRVLRSTLTHCDTLAIASGVAMDPKVIFFDEPTSASDPELRDEVLHVKRDLANAGMTMLVVTHELRFAREAADQVVYSEVAPRARS